MSLAESGDSLRITVPVGSLRKQVIHVEFGKTDASGNPTLAYWSVCGPYVEKNAADLLRFNTSTLHGAFAVRKVSGAEMVVLQANQLAEAAIPLEVSRILSALAWQADQAEQKLIGGDAY